MTPKPPNAEGQTLCTVRWMLETPGGWLGAWDREAFAEIERLRAERDEAVSALQQAKREPLTATQVVACLVEAGCLGTVTLSFDHGSYEITRSSHKADKFARAIERAHGIGA